MWTGKSLESLVYREEIIYETLDGGTTSLFIQAASLPVTFQGHFLS